MDEIILPGPISKGAKIAVISPAGSVEVSQLELGLEMLRHQGLEPVLGKYLYQKFTNGYHYAGTEKERLKDLNWALNDPEISAVWASRGGYGCQHLLKGVTLREFQHQPKWYIGYSDNTVIQSFLLKYGFASIHGQTIKTSSFGVTEESYSGIFQILEGERPNYTFPSDPLNRKGRAGGELVGGNLALIYALLGTKYSFRFKDKILFIEDIGEQYYALDRMMMSLDLAGVFKKISGLVVGGMTNMGDEKTNKGYNESFDQKAFEIIAERISKFDFPVAFGFPNGHIKDNRPLIIGANVDLNVGSKQSELIFKK